MSATSLPRTYLYVPGNASAKLAKALSRGADALIVDLEDAVPISEKVHALDTVVDWLRSQPNDLDTELWVRINSGIRRHDEVRALAGVPALRGLALAKVDDATEVCGVAEQLSALGDEDTVLMPLLESARAILNASSIAAADRVHQLQIGEIDLTGDTGIQPGPDEAEVAVLRTMVILASTAAGIDPPMAPVSVITRDPDAFIASTRLARRQGFFGRACIHPAQVPLVHHVFTPSTAEVEQARTVITRLASAVEAGSGVVLDDGGRLIDAAVLKNARKTLDLASRSAN